MKQIPPEKTQELLSRLGSCCPQEPQTPAEHKLPEHILKFYREVGPSNINLRHWGCFIPSLENLVVENAKLLELRRTWAGFHCLSIAETEKFLDEIQIIFFDLRTDSFEASTSHVVSLSGNVATCLQGDSFGPSAASIYLSWCELDMTLSTVAACMAVAEIVSAEINPDNEEKWIVEMDRQMSAISGDSAPWRDRLDELF